MAMRLGTAFFELFARNRMGPGLAQAQRQTQTAMGAMFRNISATIGAMFGLQKAIQVTFASLRSAITFQENMTRSLAIQTGITSELRSEMEGLAQTLATKTGRAAEDLAESFFFLASAGLDAQQQIASLPSAAAFATAGAFDMATAVDLLTDAQSALGLTVKDATKNMQNMTLVSDVLVRANELANASVEQFSRALTSKAATAIRTYGARMQEGVATIAVFADQGIKSQQAGNALNIVLRDMSSAAIRNKKAFKAANVAVFDGQGKFRGIANVIEDLEKKLGGMSDEMKKMTLLQLGFSDRSVAFTAALIGNSKRIREMDSALQDAAGSTQRVADKQLESLSAQLRITVEQFKVLAINTLPAFIKAFNAITSPIAKVAQFLGTLDRKTGGVGSSFVAMSAAIIALNEVFLKLSPLIAKFAFGLWLRLIESMTRLTRVVTGPVKMGLGALVDLFIGWIPLMGGVTRAIKGFINAAVDIGALAGLGAGVGIGFGVAEEIRRMSEETKLADPPLSRLEKRIARIAGAYRNLSERQLKFIEDREKLVEQARGELGLGIQEVPRRPTKRGKPGAQILDEFQDQFSRMLGLLKEITTKAARSLIDLMVRLFNKMVHAIGLPSLAIENFGGTVRGVIQTITGLMNSLNTVLEFVADNWEKIWGLMEDTAIFVFRKLEFKWHDMMKSWKESTVDFLEFFLKVLNALSTVKVFGDFTDEAKATMEAINQLEKDAKDSAAAANKAGGEAEKAWDRMGKAALDLFLKFVGRQPRPELLPAPFVDGEDAVKKAAAAATAPGKTPEGRVPLFTAFEALGKEIQSAIGGEDKLGEIADSTAASKKTQEELLQVTKKMAAEKAALQVEMLPPPNVAEPAPAGAGGM